MKKLKLTAVLLTLILSIGASATGHEMQHGFILSEQDTLGSHLVANGHHSRQVEIVGELVIQDTQERAYHQLRKEKSVTNQSYFLFQAQDLDLPSLAAGTLLTGHIVESKIGNYEPKNIIVKSATFQVQKVLLNILNPFFTDEPKEKNLSIDILNNFILEKKHCCDTGTKPCNWKC